jgi:hypothetical protein
LHVEKAVRQLSEFARAVMGKRPKRVAVAMADARGAIDHCATAPSSLAQVNVAIAELLTRLNEERPIRRLGVTRRKLLEEIDRPALKALPEGPYVFAEWRICRVSIDYHVAVEAHYYSVPHRFVRAEVEVRGWVLQRHQRRRGCPSGTRDSAQGSGSGDTSATAAGGATGGPAGAGSSSAVKSDTNTTGSSKDPERR